MVAFDGFPADNFNSLSRSSERDAKGELGSTMTDRAFGTSYRGSVGGNRLTNISRRAALAFWVVASATAWVGLVASVVVFF
jgi:hypothetical protein